jgi:hypothetical protein
MRFFSQHTIIAGRILAILFVLANSGFTTVLRQCTMKSDAPMECCSIPEKSDATNRDAVQKDVNSPSIVGQFSCHTITIVGGIASTNALLQRESSNQNSNANACCNHLQQSTLFKIYTTYPGILSYFSATISPPTVEKRVLNSSFLI